MLHQKTNEDLVFKNRLDFLKSRLESTSNSFYF